MTIPFQPADGERARWRHLYDLVVSRQPGEDISYLEAMELLECDRAVALAAMYEARRHLELDRKQTIRTVRGFGWVILAPRDNLAELEQRRKKGDRANDRHARLVVATPRDGLSQIDKARLDQEKRSAIARAALAGRRTKSFVELQRESKTHEKPHLPLGQGEAS